jgi:AcrR family transcriptional regulator
MKMDDTASVRRAPRQQRSRQTVEAVLGAVPVVIRREGVNAVTTNRIADAAGVSIGSLYQYFPDKRAIFAALHERHVDEVRGVIEQAIAEHGSSLPGFTRALVEGLADVHAAEPELHELISADVPAGPLAFRNALQATFERVTSSERILFVLPNLIESLVHGVAQRPTLKNEAVRTVFLYLESCLAA